MNKILVIMFLFGFAFSAYAADGKELFNQNECIECHYEDDFSGEPQEDIIEWIKGIVGGTTRHKVELTFTDEEIELLAEYLANVEYVE